MVSAFYLHLEVADEPGVLAQVAQVLADDGVSVKSVVQKGLRDQARLVMVVHPVLESRFFAAMELISGLDALRAPPRLAVRHGIAPEAESRSERYGCVAVGKVSVCRMVRQPRITGLGDLALQPYQPSHDAVRAIAADSAACRSGGHKPGGP